MAKQSFKDSIYQQIANSQVQQVIKDQRDQDYKLAQDLIAQYQPTNDDMALAQNLIAQYQQPAPQPTPQPEPVVSQPQVPVLKKQTGPTKEEKLKAFSENYARQQQEESMLQSAKGNAEKQAKREAAVKAGRDKFFGKEADAVVKQAKADKVLSEGKKVTPVVGNRINQVDLSQYNLPSNGFTEEEQKAFVNAEKAKQWTQPGYKMSKEEQKEAKRIAAEGKQALAEKYPVTNKADYGKLLDRMSPEDRENYIAFEDLGNKADSFASMSVGAADKAVSTLGGLFDLYALSHPFNPNAARSAKAYEELVQDNWNEKAARSKDLAQNSAPLVENVPVIGEITPYGVGEAATQLGAYMATEDIFNEIGAMASGSSKVGQFLGNQVGQNLQDVALDTEQLVKDLAKDGELSAEDKQKILNNIKGNALGNLFFGGLQEVPGLVKGVGDNIAAKNAADAAFRENVRAGADKLSQIANEIPGIENVNNIDNISKQISNLPDYVTGGPTGAYDVAKNIEPEPIKEAVEEVSKSGPKLSAETQEQIASDFEEIYNGMEDMRSIVESSGDAKVAEKYEKLQQAVFKYEELAYNSESLEEINKAKKAADAARQGFIRAAKKIDPNFKGSLTGTKLGNAEFRRTSTAPTDSALLDEIVDDMVKQDIENPNRFVRDAEPDSANVYRGVNSEAPKDYSIQEVNRKGGKKGYYVAESTGDGATKNVEPGKVYKTKEEAEKVLNNYKLQTFAGGDGPKENWKTSKLYTNTATKKGWSDKLDAKDYGYRATNAQEQESVFKNRYKDSKDIVRDLVELDSFDDADMRGAMNTMEKLMEGSVDDIRKASRLGKKISFEGREGGRVVQAIGEAKANTPAGQLREAQKTIGDAIDKRVGEGTSEALDNLYEKVMKSYEDSATKEEFSKKLEDLLTGDLKQHVSSKTAKKMQSKQIKGLNKIIKMIDNAESLDNIKIDDLMDVMYKLNGGVLLSPQTEKEVYELLKEASKLDPSSYEFRRLQAQAARKVMAEVPSGLGDYVRAFLYDNMLGNFKTAFSRNFIGNMAYQSLEKVRELPSAAVDKLVSLKTGKHSSLGWNKGKRKAYTEGFKTGGLETLKDIRSGVNTTRSGQTGWKETLSNNRTVHNDNAKLGHWANQVDFYVENAMKGGDRPVYEANYAEFKTELEQLLDRYGKDGVVGLENVKDEDISDVIDKIAAVRAADAVFQKKGHMSEGLTKLRDGLGELSKGALGVDILSTASTPFTLTPGNMLEKAVEYTPLGVVKNAVETAKELRGGGFNQRRFVEEAGRTITGLPVLLAAYAGAKNGIINGGLSEDQDEKQAQLDDGFIEYGLNVPEQVPLIGGKTLDTSDLPVYGPFAQAGAAMTEEGLTPNSMLQAGEAVLGGSATQGIRRAFGAENGMYSGQGGLLDNLKNTVMASGTQLVPSLVRQTAQTTDKYKRDLGEYGTNEYYLNSIKNSIPGLRQTLPIKTDVEGQPILQNQGRNIVSKALENYVLPMNMSEYKPSALNEEASRLLDATDKAWAFQPKALRKDLRQWDEKAGMKFTEKQFRMYKENLGKKNAQMGNALLKSDYYKKLDDEAKVEAMQSVYSAMKALAKENATGIKSDDKIVAAYKKGKEKGVINYLYGNSLIEEAGISKQSNAAKEAMKLAEQGKFSKAKKVIDDYAKYKEISDQYDVSDGTFIPSDTAQAIKDKIAAGDTIGARQLAKQQSELQSYGFGSDSGMAKYQKAKDIIPGLTTKQFATTYKGMDANGKSGISQTEFLDYVNSLDLTPEQAQQYLEAYGGWENKEGQQKKLVGSSGHYDLTY